MKSLYPFLLVVSFFVSRLQLQAQLLISQYIETSLGSTPKGIEIWNVSDSTINFAQYNLNLLQGTNGATPTNLQLVSSGSLASGEVMVIGTSDVDSYLKNNDLAGVYSIIKALQFNGDDALVLKLAGNVVDVFGTPGVDPGTAWSGNGVSTANSNISLKAGIKTGTLTGFTDPSTRFETVSSDNSLTGFGIAPLLPSIAKDTLAPIPTSITILNEQQIQVFFNEVLEPISAELTINYTGIANLESAHVSADSLAVTLNFSPAFKQGVDLSLQIQNITDTAGNVMLTSVRFPVFYNATKPNLRITEINYNNPGADDYEFIELFNNSADTAFLGDFYLSGVVYTFPHTAQLAPWAYLVICNNSAAAQTVYPNAQLIEWTSGTLSNIGELIAISNALGFVLDSLSYLSNAGWPSSANGGGPSLELKNVALDNSNPSNWRASFTTCGSIPDGRTIQATPGYGYGAVLSLLSNSITAFESKGYIDIPVYAKKLPVDSTAFQIKLLAGTAKSKNDYSLSQTLFTYVKNKSNAIRIPLIKDEILEKSETFSLILEAFGAGEIKGFDTILITIFDDEQAAIPPICINELQTKNTHTLATSTGEFIPWIELHNPNTTSLALSNYVFIQNGELIPLSGTIPANGYSLIWADSSSSISEIHANMRLSPNGTLHLARAFNLSVVDKLRYTEMQEDASFGRLGDCGIETGEFSKPTPNAKNDVRTAINLLRLDESPFLLNPAIEGTIVLKDEGKITLTDLTGRMVYKAAASKRVHTTNLMYGYYVVHFENGQTAKILLNNY